MERGIIVLQTSRHFDDCGFDVCCNSNELSAFIRTSHQTIQRPQQRNCQRGRSGDASAGWGLAVRGEMKPRAGPEEMDHLRDECELLVTGQLVYAIESRFKTNAAIA